MGARRSSDFRYERGTRIPGTVYEVISEIGHGGMGRVYEVEDTTVGKRYALKTLLVKRAFEEGALVIERMRQESRTLVRVAHPNIVDVITAGVSSDGQFYYVMELLTGKPLRKLLARKKRLESHLAVPIAIDVAEALARAHSEGVIHRDVKPDNIFIVFREDTSTTVKVVDFGVAGLLDDLLVGREAGRLMGTLKYASPEQQRGGRAEPAMDIWGLGVTLFEMLVGHLPFRAKSMQEYIRAVQGPHPADRISEFLADVPPELDALCGRLLEKDAARRIPSMVLAASELRGVQRILQERRQPAGDDHRTEETLGGAVAPSHSPGDRRDAEDGVVPADDVDEHPAVARAERASARPTPLVAAITLVGMGPFRAPHAPRGPVLASTTLTPDPPEEWHAWREARSPRAGRGEERAVDRSNESDTRFLDVAGHEALVLADREASHRGIPTPELPVVIPEPESDHFRSAEPARDPSALTAIVLPLVVFVLVVGLGGAAAVFLARPSAVRPAQETSQSISARAPPAVRESTLPMASPETAKLPAIPDASAEGPSASPLRSKPTSSSGTETALDPLR